MERQDYNWHMDYEDPKTGWEVGVTTEMSRNQRNLFNITIIQVYAPAGTLWDEKVEEFYHQLPSLIDHTPRNDLLVMQGAWNVMVGKEAQENWTCTCTCGPYCNEESHERGPKALRLCHLWQSYADQHPINHQEDGPGTAQTVSTITRQSILSGNVYGCMSMPQEEKAFLEKTLGVIMTWWWTFTERGLRNHIKERSNLKLN